MNDPTSRQPQIDADPAPLAAPMPAVETPEIAAMMGRMARAWARRIGEADTYDLAEMVEFGRTFEDAIRAGIRLARERQPEAFSWANIGDAVGMSKQAAQQRWGDRAQARTS